MSSEDEAVASDLDMHALILGGLSDAEPVKTAEEVIREIDDIMEVTAISLLLAYYPLLILFTSFQSV